VLASLLSLASPCLAQSLTTAVGAQFGAGIERGGNTINSAVKRAPMFLDASVRHWTDEESRFAVGGSLRLELEGAGEVGVAPRAELRFPLGKWELRPGIAGAFYILPHTMFGPEASLALRKPLGNTLGLLAMFNVAAFIIGNDVPKDASVLLVCLSIGVDMEL
jgi:hypothetical protein